MKNLFVDMSDSRLRNALIEYEVLRTKGIVPEDGILAPIRDQYCDENMALGVHHMEMDLLYAGASRWIKNLEENHV